jgi:hypothetical protein
MSPKRQHTKDVTVIIEYANGEKETIKCSHLVAEWIYRGSFSRGHTFVVIQEEINGEVYRYNNNCQSPEDREWHVVL